ncbi:MAG: YceI family protein [Proteobacteria bacterium]|nr:YceI family protein [Pseudomonadota bacterium]
MSPSTVLLLALCCAAPRWASAASPQTSPQTSPQAGPQAGPQTWRVSAGEVSYRLEHKFHLVEGRSRSVEGLLLIDDAGAKVMVRLPVKSFDSGNANRDAHMLEVVEGARYPFVVLKALVPAPALHLKDAPGAKLALTAELDFHGVKARRTITVAVTRRSPRQMTVTFAFPVSLEAHRVERPSLLFIKVKDAIQLSGTLRLEAKP